MKLSHVEVHEVACPLCGSDNHSVVLQAPDWTGYVAGEFRIVRCRQCTHLFLNPAPTDSSLADCYPRDYGPHQRQLEAAVDDAVRAENRCEEDSHQNLVRRPWYLSSVVKAIPGLRAYYRWVTETRSVWIPPESGEGKRALELGCSSGWFLAQLREHGWSPVGLDLVPGPLAQARAAGFEVYEGQLSSGLFEAETFDAAFAWMVVEHVPRPVDTLRNLHRVLRPGGWFAFSVPSLSSWEPRVFGRHWRGYDLPRHLQHFTVSRLQSLLDEQGFAIVKIVYQPSFLYWTSSIGSWLKVRFPHWKLGERLMGEYENAPPLAGFVCLGPWAHLNALVRQSGRVTIVTRRR